MRILVFNSGSATLKFQLFETNPAAAPGYLPSATLTEPFANALSCAAEFQSVARGSIEAHGDYAQAALGAFAQLRATLGEAWAQQLTMVGHRIVHGGERFVTPTLVTPQVLSEIESLSTLAPLHNPPALEVIRTARSGLADSVPMYAVFDTAFYHDLPDAAKHYALPAEWRQKYALRRYGFHGIAHRYLYERYTKLNGQAAQRVITLQLGQGCSMTALRDGKPVDTSMGFTPLEGLVMATRSGDVDAGVLLHLLRAGVSMDELSQGLNARSGLLGLSESSGDMRELLRLEAQGHEGAALAVNVFCQRARKYLGAYLALLGGADAIIFGGGIGEHAPQIRARILLNMEWCGLLLDEPANAAAVGAESCVSEARSAQKVYVIPVQEELLIAKDICRL